MDPLNVDLIVYASEKLGKENIGISTSGVFLDEEVLEKLTGKVNDVELTLDYIPYKHYPLRPVGYHEYAANAMIKLKKHGFYVGAQTVLTTDNIEPHKIKALFNWLESNGIDEWSLLRFFSAGRGKHFEHYEPTYMDYVRTVDYIRELTKDASINVHFQYLLPNHDKYTLECRVVKKSVGILPDGKVVSCFWGLDTDMNPIDEGFVLGTLPDTHIKDILASDKAALWSGEECSCRIFSYEELETEITSLEVI